MQRSGERADNGWGVLHGHELYENKIVRLIFEIVHTSLLYFQTFECLSSTLASGTSLCSASGPVNEDYFTYNNRLKTHGSHKYQYQSNLQSPKFMLRSYRWYRVPCPNPSATKSRRISSLHGFYGFLRVPQVGWQVRIHHSGVHHLGNHQSSRTRVAADVVTHWVSIWKAVGQYPLAMQHHRCVGYQVSTGQLK